jgi:hypothetical protein
MHSSYNNQGKIKDIVRDYLGSVSLFVFPRSILWDMPKCSDVPSILLVVFYYCLLLAIGKTEISGCSCVKYTVFGKIDGSNLIYNRISTYNTVLKKYFDVGSRPHQNNAHRYIEIKIR